MQLKDYFPEIKKEYSKIFFSGIAFESSKIKKNYIFFAIKGNNLDGNNFIDYIMGLMPIVLGYSDPFVDAAVVRQIEKGTSLSLPGKLEAKLSEILVKLIPCAEMVRFGKKMHVLLN